MSRIKANRKSSLEKLRSKKRSKEELVVPWLQMPGEPTDAFNSFTEYRKIPPEDRSISALLKLPAMITLAGAHQSSWFYGKANSWAWVSRAEAFDNWSRYNHLTKQFGRFQQALDKQAKVGRKLVEKAAMFLLGGEDDEVTVSVNEMWVDMEPKDLINALRLGTQIEREAFKLQREALVGNESFVELDELTQMFKPGSVQEQMFEAVMRDDWDGLVSIMEKVVNANRDPHEMAMPSKGSELSEAQRDKVRVMANKLLKGVLSAPDELIAELAEDMSNGTQDSPSLPN